MCTDLDAAFLADGRMTFIDHFYAQRMRAGGQRIKAEAAFQLAQNPRFFAIDINVRMIAARVRCNVINDIDRFTDFDLASIGGDMIFRLASASALGPHTARPSMMRADEMRMDLLCTMIIPTKFVEYFEFF